MADDPKPNSNPLSIDPNSGYCFLTNTFHSIRPTIPLPHPSFPLTLASYAYSLFLSSYFPSISMAPAFIDSTTSPRISFSDFFDRIQTLSLSLKTLLPSLSKNQTAFVLSPYSLHIPILYFSLLSLGIIVSPSNPASTPSETSRQIHLSSPVIAFAMSSTSHKLPSSLPTILFDSPHFHSMMTTTSDGVRHDLLGPTSINQSNPAAILYSSRTMGNVKGVVLTHQNFIAMVAGVYAGREKRPAVVMVMVSLFHVYGFVYCLRSAAMEETVVLMERRFEVSRMLRAVEGFRVTHEAVALPVVVVMAKAELVVPYDLSLLRWVGCSGAPLGKEVMERFRSRFPNVQLAQVSDDQLGDSG